MTDKGPAGSQPISNRARVFDDEKKRITRSCFSKVDEEGHLVESYITHCRIIEDNQYPSAPPPPNSPSEQKKSRVIIVAVRKSGRVRMHKARENPNGSFSIGKVWDFDELSQIENHTGDHEKGFTVTLTKPYYWQAMSKKEKDLFVQSLVKIYQKYTGGKLPSLIGFEGTELEAMTRGAAIAPPPPRRQPRPQEAPPPVLQEPPPARRQRSVSRTRSPVPAATPAVSGPASSGSQSSSLRSGDPRWQGGPTGGKSLETFNTASNASMRSNMSQDRMAPPPRSAGRNLTPSNDGPRDALPPPSPRRKMSDASTRSALSGSINIGQSMPRDDRDNASVLSTSSKTSKDAVRQEQKSEPLTLEKVKLEPIKTVTSPTSPATTSSQIQTPSPASSMTKESVASKFRMAANVYALGRKKTPTTPGFESPKTPQGKDKVKSPGIRNLQISGPMPIVSPPPTTTDMLERKEERKPSFSLPDEQEGVDSPASSSRPSTSNNYDPYRMDGQSEGNTTAASTPPPIPVRKRAHTFTSHLEGFDRSTLEVDVEAVLNEFNWDSKGRVEVLEDSIKRELENVESKNIIVNTEGDERIQELEGLLDQAIAECEKMDGLLTLYAVELTTLAEDIAHIEEQSQGLQVQTANQRTLKKELKSLLDTVSISATQLEILKQEPLESKNAQIRIEDALMSLYKALATIDPSIGMHKEENDRAFSYRDETIGSMRALQDKKDDYKMDARMFLGRLRQFLDIKFKAELMELAKTSDKGMTNDDGRPRIPGHDQAYYRLHKFSGFILFAKDIDRAEYIEIGKLYQRPTRELFQEQFRDHIFAWKRITRKPTADDTDLIFTVPEKESESVKTTAVRSLTVKRSHGRIRGDGSKSKDKSQEGKVYWHEAFSGALLETFTMIFREQNFITELFHLMQTIYADFPDFINIAKPDERKLGDLGVKRPMDMDKSRAKELFEFMGEVFGFWVQDMQNFVDWAIKIDPLQGVGVLRAMEEKIVFLEDSNQEFLYQNLKKLHARLEGLFNQFVDQQVQAIEDTKIKLKKRKGVLGFVRVFPNFAIRLEEQLKGTKKPVRRMVDTAYDRINTAMFESLNAIAKEQSPAVPTLLATSTIPSTSHDPEDKEALNSHILLIENAHHYMDTVSTLIEEYPNEKLSAYLEQARRLYEDHLAQYSSAVLRRPLGKVLDFVEAVESAQDKENITSRPSTSKQAWKKIHTNYDVKEIKKGVETLKKRIEKHFAEGDEEEHSAKLISELTKTLGEAYIDIAERLAVIGREVYGEQSRNGGVEWGREDVWSAFRK